MLEQSVTTARDKSPIILYFTILFSNIGTYSRVSYCFESSKMLPIKMKEDRVD